LRSNERRYSHETDTAVAVDLSFERHNESVIKLAVNQARPAPKRNAIEG
jgi:hypothetical protein